MLNNTAIKQDYAQPVNWLKHENVHESITQFKADNDPVNQWAGDSQWFKVALIILAAGCLIAAVML